MFDGHGPSGHMVARHVRDILPSKLSAALKQLPFNTSNNADDSSSDNIDDHGDNNDHGPVYSSVKASLIQSFKVTDEILEDEPMIESYSSGTTAVTVLKKVLLMFIINLQC